MSEQTIPANRLLAPFAGASLKSWGGLTVLILIGLYMFMDRQIIVLQVQGITGDLGLSDFQFGLIQGLSIATFAAIVGYPIAWLSDKIDRRYVLAGAILVWSAAVAACGLAGNFSQLFAASAVVGAGEAALLPIVYALIPELFRGQSRYTANSTLVLASRLGSGVVMALCGLLILFADDVRPYLPGFLADMATWRLSLFFTALPGPILAAIVLFLPIENPKAEKQIVDTAQQSEEQSKALKFLGQNLMTFLPFYVAIGLVIFGLSASGAFLPVVAIREMGASPPIVGAGIGSATLISTIIAMAIVVVMSSYFARKFGERAPIMLLFMASGLAMLTAPLFLLAQTPQHIFLLVGVHFTFTFTGMMAFPTAIQDMCPAASRARLVAIIIAINLAFSAASPAVVGFISDRLGEGNLLLAIVIVATSAFFTSVLAFLPCAQRYAQTVRHARSLENTPAVNMQTLRAPL